MTIDGILGLGVGALLGASPSIVEGFRTRGQVDAPLADTMRSELGLSDYLIYEELVLPEIIMTVSGAIGSLIEFEWQDTAVVDDNARMAHCDWLNAALNATAKLVFGDSGWAVQAYLVGGKAPRLAMPRYIESDARRLLAESRVAHLDGKRMLMRNVLAVSHQPASDRMPWLKRIFTTGTPRIERDFDKTLSDLRKGLTSIEDRLGNIGKGRILGTHPADHERNELLEMIIEIGYGIVQPIRVGHPFHAAPIARLLAACDIDAGLDPRIGEKYLRVVSAFGYPGTTTPDMLDALQGVSADGLRLVSRVVFDDADRAFKKATYKRDVAAGKKKDSTGNVDQHAQDQQSSTERFMRDIATGRVSSGQINVKAVLLNEDAEQIDIDARAVAKAMQSAGMTAKVETMNAMEAWLGVFPLDTYHDPREGPAHTMNFARLSPSSSRWNGRMTWTCKQCGPNPPPPALIGLTRTGEDFGVDPHCGDSQSSVLYGKPGTRKTSCLNCLICGYPRSPRHWIGGMDNNRGMMVPTLFLNGVYHQKLRYWLFGNLEKTEKRAFLTQFFVQICALNGYVVHHQEKIAEAIDQMYADGRPWDYSLSSFLGIYGGIDADDGRPTEILARYAVGGIYDGIFDGTYDLHHQSFNQREVYELGHLLGGGSSKSKEVVAGPTVLWTFRIFEERMPGYMSVIVCDEAWAQLESEILAAELNKRMRTMRSHHSGVIFATHNISDVMRSAVGQTVHAACRNKFLFPNHDATGILSGVYGKDGIGLNEAQLESVASAPVGTFAIYDGDKFGLCDPAYSPLEAALFGHTGQDEIAATAALIEEKPDSWREPWLRDRGFTREAEVLRSARIHGSISTGLLEEVLAS